MKKGTVCQERYTTSVGVLATRSIFNFIPSHKSTPWEHNHIEGIVLDPDSRYSMIPGFGGIGR